MRKTWIAVVLIGIAGTTFAAVKPASPVQALAGRYSEHFRNGNVDGDEYWSDNVVEIVPINATHAYFRISLQFFNGHSCSMHGVARSNGTGLDYYTGSDRFVPNCHMTLRRQGNMLRLDDHDGTCQSSCGARGGYGGDGPPWKSKRSITYLGWLKSSSQYREAIAEWRKSGAK